MDSEGGFKILDATPTITLCHSIASDKVLYYGIQAVGIQMPKHKHQRMCNESHLFKRRKTIQKQFQILNWSISIVMPKQTDVFSRLNHF